MAKDAKKPAPAVNLRAKLDRIGDYWKPKIIAELNDSYVKLVKLNGEFVWHHHAGEDELFHVLKGRLRIDLPDGPEPDLDRCTTPGEVAVLGTLRVRGAAAPPAAPEYEPVHGLTRRQLDDYLARNPGYRSTYEAELHRRCRAAAPEGNGSSLTNLRKLNLEGTKVTDGGVQDLQDALPRVKTTH